MVHCTVKGQAAHTGTTPMHERVDAVVAASKMILYSNHTAHAPGALALTRIIKVMPSSMNAIADPVEFSLDTRAVSNSILDELEKYLRKSFNAIARGDDVGDLNTRGERPKPCSVASGRSLALWRGSKIPTA